MIAATQQLTPSNPSATAEIITLTDAMNTQIFLPSKLLLHTPKSGLNPIVDAAGYFLSVIGELTYQSEREKILALQKELIDELETFNCRAQALGYPADYIAASRYILCATFDDISQSKVNFEPPEGSLLHLTKQDLNHHKAYFNILARALKEPESSLDLLELFYISLSLGYRGRYRNQPLKSEEFSYLTHSLYKTIRSVKGSLSKSLSPTPFRMAKNSVAVSSIKLSFLKTMAMTCCLVITIFISLGYLMDLLTNDAYSKITQLESQLLSSSISQ